MRTILPAGAAGVSTRIREWRPVLFEESSNGTLVQLLWGDHRVESELASALEGGRTPAHAQSAIETRQPISDRGLTATDRVGDLSVAEPENEIREQLDLIGVESELPCDDEGIDRDRALPRSQCEPPSDLDRALAPRFAHPNGRAEGHRAPVDGHEPVDEEGDHGDRQDIVGRLGEVAAEPGVGEDDDGVWHEEGRGEQGCAVSRHQATGPPDPRQRDEMELGKGRTGPGHHGEAGERIERNDPGLAVQSQSEVPGDDESGRNGNARHEPIGVPLGTKDEPQDERECDRDDAEKGRETVASKIKRPGESDSPKWAASVPHPAGPSLAATTSDASSTAIAFIVSTNRGAIKVQAEPAPGLPRASYDIACSGNGRRPRFRSRLDGARLLAWPGLDRTGRRLVLVARLDR
jgi:hypothetical protein